MSNTPRNYDDQALLTRLKDILLRDNVQELSEIKKVLDTKEHLSVRVSPIIEEHLQLLKENFSTEYEVTINKLIEAKIKDSQDQILDTIYPALGRMIKKYITFQFQQLKENIDSKVKSTFSFDMVKRRIKAIFTGVSESDLILSTENDAKVEEIFLIERDSGLLMGSACLEENMDQDVIAGMLTAIKSFVEDAFKKEKLELELIEYGHYKILIQTFYSYYMAAAIIGTLTSSEKEEIAQKMHDFVAEEISNQNDKEELTLDIVSKKLHSNFIKPLNIVGV